MARIILSHSEEETLELGRQIGRQVKPPCTILLFGELGSGKTVLARGICEGLGVEPGTAVHSPTFTLVNEYPSDAGTVYHVDLYRLESMRDLYSIGIEDLLLHQTVMIVEWAEKLKIEVADPIRIHLSRTDEAGRRLLRIEPELPAALSH
jgi:tRNA threonylcarbamoyladenosine biosynthesis protein TsaE